jgi:glycolate oxidase iron-sulfur subunit
MSQDNRQNHPKGRHKTLEDFREQIDACVKCGACQAQCAVYKSLKRESTVARGKVAIADALLDKKTPVDERFVLDMSQCLLCGSCRDKCPNLVPTDEIVMAARREIAERQGLSTFGKALTGVIKRPKLMNLLAKSGSHLEKLIFRKVPEHSGLRLRFPVPFVAKDRYLPEMTPKPFRERVPEYIPAHTDNATKPLSAFFTGCMINFTYPQIGEALVKIFRFLDLPLWVPAHQGCCGLPAHAAGDAATVDQLADANVGAFRERKADTIITACASCNAGIGKHYRDMGDQYADLGDQVEDVLVFLVRHGLVGKLRALPAPETTTRVTYHDPCHLRTQGITAEPRALLKALPGVEFVEMEGADRCCGLGGTFSVYHYDTSRSIGARKAEGIAGSGAELVASACPGCIMQLQDSINHAGLKLKACHVLELIARELPEQDWEEQSDV